MLQLTWTAMIHWSIANQASQLKTGTESEGVFQTTKNRHKVTYII